ncbi:MAG TPA: hypothetical protein VHW23_12570 [Kofleriaceae bacterium]|jgi:hypothetical protein|nr:hypothetical protein [Kofleriaceae bacterium]
MDGAPDFSRNYIRLPRAELRELWAHPTALLVYIELLDRAAFQPGPRMIDGRVVDLAIGQCVAGRGKLAERCSTSEQTIRTSLNHLQTLQLITIASTSRGSVITICGYAESLARSRGDQPAEQPADQPAGHQPTNQQSTSHPTSNGDLRSETLRSENRDLPPARAIPRSTEPEPAPVLPASIARAETRRRVIGESWQIGGDAFRELGREGIEPTAFDPWAGMPGAGDEGMKLLIAHVDRLLVGDPPDVDRALAVIRRRVAVAVAEGRAAAPPTRRWLTPMRVWDPTSFAKGAEMSPEQVRPRPRPGTPQPAAPPPTRRPDPPAPPSIAPEDRAGAAELAAAWQLLGITKEPIVDDQPDDGAEP